MFIPPAYDPEDRLRGLRRELAGDVSRVVEDLEFRREFLREIWSVSRDRGAFLDTITGKWRELTADDLLEFPPEDVVAIDGFYRALEAFHLYLAFTEDMPATAWITCPPRTVPRVVSTSAMRPFSILRPVTSVRWWNSTPSSVARAA